MKYRFYIFTVLLMGLFSDVSAQTSTPTFSDGLYISFEDLKASRSVTDLPYRQETLSSKDGVSRYAIYHQGKFRKIKRIYCFVNKNFIYLNSGKYGRKGYFVRSHFVGRYSYFEDRLGNDKFSSSRGIASSNGPAVESKIWGIILDMKTGKVVKATKRNMKKLLASHPDLLQEYLDGKRTSVEVKELIIWLNKKS